jgi:tetratricopeptide (TPR) repeat protein
LWSRLQSAPVRVHVAIAVAVALALRLVHLWLLVRADPLLIDPVVDAAGYHEWAVEILADPVGDDVFFQSPLYPYAVALWYAIVGVSWVKAAVGQAILGAVSVLLAAAVTRQVAPGKPAAAVVAAWLMALYQPLIYYDALLLKVELTNAFVLLVLWAFLSGMARVQRVCDAGTPPSAFVAWLRPLSWLIGAGFLLGLLGLLRGNFYLALPLLLVWCIAAPTRGDWRLRAARVTAFAAGFAVVVALVSVRNKVVADQWVFSSAGSGAVLYIGNNENSPMGDYTHMPFVRTNPKYEEIDFRHEADRRTGRSLTTAEASKYWQQQAIDYSLADPVLTMRRGLHKLALVAESYELGDNYSPKFHAEFSPLGAPWFPWWTLVLSLSAGWMLSRRKGWVLGAPVAIVAVTYIASLVIFFVRSRYRIPLVPCFVVLAAVELVALRQLWTDGHKRRVAVHGAVIALVAMISLGLGVPRASGEQLGGWWANLGARHVEAGNTEHGIKLMQKGWQLEPKNSIIHMNLGRVYLGVDEPNKARFHCGQAIELESGRDDARECLTVALLELGLTKDAKAALTPALRPRMPLDRYLLAAAVEETLGDKPAALRWLAQARQVYGDDPALAAHLERLQKRR